MLGTQAVTANACIIQSKYLIVCIDSLERPISSVSTEDSFGMFTELSPQILKILERQKNRQSKNQTLIPKSRAPIPTVRYMACWQACTLAFSKRTMESGSEWSPGWPLRGKQVVKGGVSVVPLLPKQPRFTYKNWERVN